jgi:hypothetical protein
MACAFGVSLLLAVGWSFAPAGNAAAGQRLLPRSPVPASNPSRVPPPLSHYDARTHATFVARFTSDRQAQLSVRAGELALEKSVSPDGSFTIDLTAGPDRVIVAMTGAGIDVSRDGSTLHVEFGQAGEDDFLAVRKLLAGSKAVRLHRLLAGNLEERTLVAPGGVATLISDAFLGLLEGDMTALERLGERVARHALGRVRRARAGNADSCYVQWENEVMDAFYQLAACKYDYAWWNPVKEVCNVRYMMRCEFAWWELLGCCAVPIK